jgi:hypothetical protein
MPPISFYSPIRSSEKGSSKCVERGLRRPTIDWSTLCISIIPSAITKTLTALITLILYGASLWGLRARWFKCDRLIVFLLALLQWRHLSACLPVFLWVIVCWSLSQTHWIFTNNWVPSQNPHKCDFFPRDSLCVPTDSPLCSIAAS